MSCSVLLARWWSAVVVGCQTTGCFGLAMASTEDVTNLGFVVYTSSTVVLKWKCDQRTTVECLGKCMCRQREHVHAAACCLAIGWRAVGMCSNACVAPGAWCSHTVGRCTTAVSPAGTTTLVTHTHTHTSLQIPMQTHPVMGAVDVNLCGMFGIVVCQYSVQGIQCDLCSSSSGC